jgi:hypothetical protein
MNDPENFLTRWSRRKREATEEVRKDDVTSDAGETTRRDVEAAEEMEPDASRQSDAKSEPPFDPASLPPIESITADTDIRAFFAPGVPADLTRAALRRAWAADPKIRDFVGLAENAWDFNNPDSIPGFGSLELTTEIRREVARIAGEFLPKDEAVGSDPAAAPRPVPESTPSPQVPEPMSQIADSSAAGSRPHEIASSAPVESNMQPVESAPETVTGRRSKVDAATQQRSRQELSLPTSFRRGHGGALPK